MEDFNMERYYDWAKHRWYEVKRRKSRPRHRNILPEGFYTGIAQNDLQPQMTPEISDPHSELHDLIQLALSGGPLGINRLAATIHRDGRRVAEALKAHPELYEKVKDHPKAPWRLKQMENDNDD